MKGLIVLVVDHDTFAADHPDGAKLTPEELTRQGGYANADAAGIYGYESWMVIPEAPADLIERLSSLHARVSEEALADALDQPKTSERP